MISPLQTKSRLFPASPLELSEQAVQEFVERQMNWFLDYQSSPSLSNELAALLNLPQKAVSTNLTVRLELLCAKVALECIPLVNDSHASFASFRTNLLLKQQCYQEMAEAVIMDFSHKCHVTHIQLPESFTVDTIVAVMEHYESSLQKNGIHWLGTCLIERLIELLEFDGEWLPDVDASYLTLLLASSGVVNFWDQEPGRRIRARNLQSRLAG